MQKLQKEKLEQRNKKSRTVIFLAGLILVFACIIRVVIANRLVEATDKLHRLEVEEEKLQADNEILSENLRTKDSLISLRSEAEKMGFAPVTQVTYIEKPLPLAAAGLP